MELATRGTQRARSRALVAAAALCGAALVAWGFVLRLGFTGVDAWPLLDQAARALGDPSALLGERYLEDVPIGGSFWRPLFVGAFSVQWAAFGEHAAPYHALRLGAYLALGALAGALARRSGASPALTWFTAGAIVLLHPVQADMIPSLARSADVVVDLMLAATILLLARPGARAPQLTAGVLVALLATGVKETGLVAPVLGVVVLEPWKRERARRLAAAILVLGLGLHLAARWKVLGSLGTYAPPGESEAEPLANAVLLARVVIDKDGLLPTALVLALGSAMLLLGRLAWNPPRPPTCEWRRVRGGCRLWLVCAVLGAVLSPRLADRHAAVLLAPAAVLLAACVGSLAERSSTPRASSLQPIALAGLLAALALALVPRSPLWRRYPQWDVIARTAELVVDAADAAQRELAQSGEATAVEFGAFRVVARAQEEGTSVAIGPFPYDAAPPHGARAASLRQPVVLMPYSVRAAMILRGHGPHVLIRPGRGVSVGPEHLGPPSPPRAASLAR